MTTYETWEKTMMERIASINKSTIPDEDKHLLKDRAVEPIGLWIQRGNIETQQSSPGSSTNSGHNQEGNEKRSFTPATDKQIKYLKSLGGNPTDNMSSYEASKAIEQLKRVKR